MLDYEVVIIGGGPAGLTAGLYLTRNKYRTLLIDKEGFGGQIKNVEWIENYPGFSRGVAGPELAAEMLNQATKYGLQLELAEVTGLELYSGSRCLQLADGRSFTTEAVIIAGGCRRMMLGVPGEREFKGRGVFSCALCEGDPFSGKVVAVCGGGDTGVTESIYMTKLAFKVILLEALPSLTATAVLQERALHNQKLEIRCGTKIASILGNKRVEAIELENVATRQRDTIPVDGVLVAAGMEPNTDFMGKIVALDAQERVRVNMEMETSVPYIYAAGDIRSGSLGQVATAVNDGASAAISVQKLLQ